MQLFQGNFISLSGQVTLRRTHFIVPKILLFLIGYVLKKIQDCVVSNYEANIDKVCKFRGKNVDTVIATQESIPSHWKLTSITLHVGSTCVKWYLTKMFCFYSIHTLIGHKIIMWKFLCYFGQYWAVVKIAFSSQSFVGTQNFNIEQWLKLHSAHRVLWEPKILCL